MREKFIRSIKQLLSYAFPAWMILFLAVPSAATLGVILRYTGLEASQSIGIALLIVGGLSVTFLSRTYMKPEYRRVIERHALTIRGDFPATPFRATTKPVAGSWSAHSITSPKEKIRLLLMETSPTLESLERKEDIEVVGKATSAETAIRLSAGLKPDIVLMDRNVLGGSFAVVAEIKTVSPDTEVVVMVDMLEEKEALSAIKAGAVGYVLRDEETAVKAIQSVIGERAFFHPEIARRLMERLARMKVSKGLTDYEVDVLTAIATGETDQEIARKFVESESLVKVQVDQILRKIGVRKRLDVATIVVRSTSLE